MKVTLEIDIEISESEDLGAVLTGYFSHQSFVRERKVNSFEILNNSSEELEETEEGTKKVRRK